MVFVPKYILILFAIILIDYLAALTIEQLKGRLRLFYLVVSLIANIGMLAFFKYFNFANENLVTVFSWFGKEFHPVNLDIILPIGLSFHTFQSMSYTIEVYRGRQKAERHLGYFANYVLFFPQMVAGPIERYETLGNELREEHKPKYENFSDGFKLILFGLFIKMAVADNIAPFVNQVYSDPMKYNSLQVLGAVFLFSFQIYADFFGYSTIALGSARMLDIKIMDNFNTPYLSKSITEFWTRWHISLSTWFRDYLYIPLGGNRVTLPRWSINILIVFMVSGLWHGASWTFVVWGALHGLMILTERYTSKILKFKIREGWNVVNVLLTIKTFIVASFIWIFFRAEDFPKAKLIIKAMVKNWKIEKTDVPYLYAFVFSIVLIVIDIFLYNSRFDKRIGVTKIPVRWAVYAVLIFCLMALSGTQKFTFIYFQF
ncbi:MAG: rane bound O-acyl transferase family protein [Bacteroidetes bacterium]|jgi:D-alanyl-lipoteichoic acid acyltransferase DltB (MBOAT superfamily)|nr:rane bound O-acyl transferase family protein [Bacteroidota bacterium]